MHNFSEFTNCFLFSFCTEIDRSGPAASNIDDDIRDELYAAHRRAQEVSTKLQVR